MPRAPGAPPRRGRVRRMPSWLSACDGAHRGRSRGEWTAREQALVELEAQMQIHAALRISLTGEVGSLEALRVAAQGEAQILPHQVAELDADGVLRGAGTPGAVALHPRIPARADIPDRARAGQLGERVAGEAVGPVDGALGRVAAADLPAAARLHVEVAGEDPRPFIEAEARPQSRVEVALVLDLAQSVPDIRVDRTISEAGLP